MSTSSTPQGEGQLDRFTEINNRLGRRIRFNYSGDEQRATNALKCPRRDQSSSIRRLCSDPLRYIASIV